MSFSTAELGLVGLGLHFSMSVLGFFVFLLDVFPGSSLLDPRGRLGGKAGSACEEGQWWWYGGLMFLRVLVTADQGCAR